MDNNELMHHGIIGMKWGVRRYQNRDGTLTARGKKRYDKEMAKLKEREQVLKNREKTQAKFDKLASKKAQLDEKERELDEREGKPKKGPAAKSGKTASESQKVVTKPKTVRDMTDQELEAVVRRMNLEKRYAELNPPTVSTGKKFMTSLNKDVLSPALKQAGKAATQALLTKLFNDYGNAIYGKIKDSTKGAEDAAKKAADKERKKAAEQEEKKTPKASDDAVDYYDGYVSEASYRRTTDTPSGAPALAPADYKKKKKK